MDIRSSVVTAALLAIPVIAACSGDGAASDDAASESLGTAEQEIKREVEPFTFGHSAAVVRGANLFMKPFPATNGNGRACATCHVPELGFGLTPEHVEARWKALQAAKKKNRNADDPLFRAIDADEIGGNTYNLLRQWGLVRVEIDLAPNVHPLDDPSARKVSLFRGVTSVFNVAITAPYQQDGRFADLQQQALGALTGHAQITRQPQQRQLDDVAEFQKLLFPNRHSFEVAKAVQRGQAPPAEPNVTGKAAEGKAIFQRQCALCHMGPALNETPLPPDAFPGDIFVSRPLPPFAIESEFPAPPPLPVRMWVVELPDGTEMVRPSTDPGKVLTTGNPLDFNVFDIPQLRGLKYTAPYFHDNSAKTLRDTLVHYQGLFAGLARAGLLQGGSGPSCVAPACAGLVESEFDPLIAYMNTL